MWEWTLAYRPRGEQKETVTFDGLNQEKLSVRTDFIDLQTKINWFPFSEGQVRPYFSGGAYVGYLLSGNFQYEIVRDPVLTYEHDLNSNLRKINAGIVAGLGIEADLGKLTLFTEAAFQKGLIQLSKPVNSELSGFTHELYLSGGYSINALSLVLGILYDLP